MNDVLKVKTFLNSYYSVETQYREETIKAVLRCEGKKNQSETLDSLLGESQFSFLKEGT